MMTQRGFSLFVLLLVAVVVITTPPFLLLALVIGGPILIIAGIRHIGRWCRWSRRQQIIITM